MIWSGYYNIVATMVTVDWVKTCNENLEWDKHFIIVLLYIIQNSIYQMVSS